MLIQERVGLLARADIEGEAGANTAHGSEALTYLMTRITTHIEAGTQVSLGDLKMFDAYI